MPSRASLSRVAILAGLFAVPASSALAERIDFDIFENADMADVSGLDLWVDVQDAGGGAVNFVFHNDSLVSSVITAIYFEASEFALIGLQMPSIFDESLGVDFSDGATPRRPAGSIRFFGGEWAGTAYGVDANPPSPINGINAGVGEFLTVRFELAGITTTQDVINAITDDPSRFRIAQHIQALPGGSSVWSIAVPTPGTASLLTLGGGLIAMRRRR